jgi:transglutaminase-like putative cysteine protease
MTTLYRVVHRTTYEYSSPVTTGHTIAHLTPRATPTQTVELASVVTDPPADHVNEFDDEFGNPTVYLAVEHPHDRLTIEAVSETAVSAGAARTPPGTAPWEDAAGLLQSSLDNEALDNEALLARRCRLDSVLVQCSDELRSYGAASFAPGRAIAEAYVDLIARIHRDFTFDPTSTDISTPVADVLAHRRGVCQDFAHLAIGCLRSLDLPARYVSGYVETAPPAGMDRLEGADASHAWCSLYIPGWGWLDADPTNDQVPPRRHVTVAWGRDYADVAPVHGVVFGPPATQYMTVSVDVRAL